MAAEPQQRTRGARARPGRDVAADPRGAGDDARRVPGCRGPGGSLGRTLATAPGLGFRTDWSFPEHTVPAPAAGDLLFAGTGPVSGGDPRFGPWDGQIRAER